MRESVGKRPWQAPAGCNLEPARAVPRRGSPPFLAFPSKCVEMRRNASQCAGTLPEKSREMRERSLHRASRFVPLCPASGAAAPRGDYASGAGDPAGGGGAQAQRGAGAARNLFVPWSARGRLWRFSPESVSPVAGVRRAIPAISRRPLGEAGNSPGETAVRQRAGFPFPGPPPPLYLSGSLLLARGSSPEDLVRYGARAAPTPGAITSLLALRPGDLAKPCGNATVSARDVAECGGTPGRS